MFVEIKHHLGEIWIKDVSRVKFENVKMVTFGFDNKSDFDEAKELFEIANCDENILRVSFNDDTKIIQVIEGTEWNIIVNVFND